MISFHSRLSVIALIGFLLLSSQSDAGLITKGGTSASTSRSTSPHSEATSKGEGGPKSKSGSPEGARAHSGVTAKAEVSTNTSKSGSAAKTSPTAADMLAIAEGRFGKNNTSTKLMSERSVGDLKPTLERIIAGEKFPHRNDGEVFRNDQSLLPQQPVGYYREYVHPTHGVDGPGVQRIVKGQGGDTYYTTDHYNTFVRVIP